MKKLYTRLHCIFLLAFFYFLPASASAQTCSGMQVQCIASESRCMATGTITVRGSGGSGNYNYKAIGPVTTTFTSSRVITGLPPGAYTVVVQDIARGCQVARDSIIVSGTYSDPRFILTKTDVTCAGNDGTISVTNQQFGREPFTYTIVAPSPVGVGTSSTTGTFTNLVAGAYAVELKDSCGGIQVRRITVQGYSWWFDGVTVTKTDCNNATAVIRLKDNRGKLNTSAAAAAFAGFTYGMVNAPGDTTWYATNSFSFFIGTKRSVTFVAKDPCGTKHRYTWNVPANTKPAVSAVAISNATCGRFTATVTGATNLTNPVFYVFDSTNTEVANNTTGVFPALPYGSYCIHVKDACYDTTIVRCFTAAPPVPSVNSRVTISERACATFTATVAGQRNLYSPDYCLYDNSGALVNCNKTGKFTNVAYGSYCIKITDSCTKAVLSRCFTVTKPVATLTSYAITGRNCTTFDVSVKGNNLRNPRYCLYDSLGNVVRCDTTGTFTGVDHGRYCIRAISCGDTTAPVCFTGRAPKPDVAPDVEISNEACSTFTAAITGQVNWTTPQYCLFDSAGIQLRCNTTGVFDSLAYGNYCIKIKDGCYDTTVVRCFTQTKPLPTISATLQQLDTTCTTFTAKVTGQKNLFDAQYCIYNAADSLLECNTTGVFDSLAYGSYCVVATDGCSGATIRVCQTFSYDYSITLATSKSCTIGSANISVYFVNGSKPFSISVLNPADSLIYSGRATANKRITLANLTAGDTYTVIGQDGCGRSDTATIVPAVSFVTKTITTSGKCPSAKWLNGSGDLNVDVSSNLGTVTPQLIKKNGATFSKTHSSNAGTAYVFSDLEPASYIVEYSIRNCSTKLYDTFALQPYAYPTQGRSALYQCDNRSVFLKADVAGGVGPYNYQIIGSTPATPSIVSAAQTSDIFNINTGTTYSLIRLRTTDACGNATLNDVSVLPLQNILITADTTCLFNNITLSVDTIQGATYSWYKKRDATDSVFLTSDKTYNIPFMQQQDAGTYVCKVELNNSCLTRIALFDLTGDCGHVFLATPLRLTGKTGTAGNLLSWTPDEALDIQYYEVERKVYEHGTFTLIGRVYVSGGNTTAYHQFTDSGTQQGTVSYRIKAVMQNGAAGYSNSISLQREGLTTDVYPNPVHTVLNVRISGTTISDYTIELFTMSGQTVYKKELQRITSVKYRYERPKNLQRGMYLLKITNRSNGAVTHHKLYFD